TNGTIVNGESRIPLINKKIKAIVLNEINLKPAKHVLKATESADLVVVCPGSLYISIIVNLILPDTQSAIISTKVEKGYVCTLMTQKGETRGYTAGEHVQAIYDHIGKRNLDSIIVHNQPINQSIKQRYADEDAEPVIYDLEKLKELDLKIIERDIIEPNQDMLRHDTKKIANILYEMAFDTKATLEKE